MLSPKYMLSPKHKTRFLIFNVLLKEMPIVIVLLTVFVGSYFGSQEEKYFPDFKRSLHNILLYSTVSYPLLKI